GYVGLTTVSRTKSFPLALLSGALSVALIGLGMERFFLRRLSRQSLPQVLMTMGFALVFQDLGLLVWGGDPYTLAVPAFLAQSVQVGPVFVQFYRLFIIAVAFAVGIVLWVFLERTRAGGSFVATVEDAEMAEGVGVNVPLLSPGVLAPGGVLAAL